MNLPNTHFEEFPIDFKEINPADFEGFEVGDKINIPLNKEGYLTEALSSSLINIDEKNTVVINAGVGQGKTHSIIKIIRNIIQNNADNIVFVASPFVSLVEQYYNQIIKSGADINRVYRYDMIGNRGGISSLNCRIHIVTANLLLGNPGEDSLINSNAKREYINSLVDKYNRENKKVFFIYDEIHDTIHNFRQDLIFNLWKWKDVIHKNFVISATFNEASKVVIEYLAELTDKKIQILESERKRFIDRQSELYLHFNSALSYKNLDENITKLVQKLVGNGKDIDILSYSRKLAEDIKRNTKEGIGKVLFDKYGENVKLCISQLQSNTPASSSQEERFSSENRYDSTKCNVGTNFKSGVSIEKDNHAFIIIMPPSGARKPFKNEYGIFSDGINSVIQALARQRKKGEIHIVLPHPGKFYFDSLPFENPHQKEVFQSFYEKNMQHIGSNRNEVKYYSVNQQAELIKKFYENTYLDNVKDEVEYVNTLNRSNLASLSFPNYKDYKLSDGERFLARTYPFFGGDLSAYILYGAITNHFLNCRLVNTTNTKGKLELNEDNKQEMLSYIYIDFMADVYNCGCTESDLLGDIEWYYKYFHDYIFDYYNVLINGIKVSEWRDKKIEVLIFTILRRRFLSDISECRIMGENGMYLYNYEEYTRGEYLRECIAYSEKYRVNMESSPDKKLLVRAYLKMKKYRDSIIEMAEEREIRGVNVKYIPKTNSTFIPSSELEEFSNMINIICEKDILFNKEIFDFKRELNSGDASNEDKIKAFYKYLKKDFLKVKTRKISEVDYDEIVEIIPIDTHAKFMIYENEAENINNDDNDEDFFRE